MVKLHYSHWLLIGHLAITLFLAQALNIWIDEFYSLNTTSQTLSYALERSIHYEIQPPLYFLLLTVWRHLNDSIFWARLFSVGCMALAVYLSTGLAHRYLKSIHPAWLTASLAFHPYSIWAAVEIRTYAFCILLSVLLLLFFFDGYLAVVESRSAKWFYGLTVIAALYTHYFLACLLIGQGAVLLLLRRWPQLRHYLLSMAVVSLCFLPLIASLMGHLEGGGAYGDPDATALTGLQAALGRAMVFALPTASDWESAPVMRLLRYGLFGVFLLLLVAKRRWMTTSNWIVWGICGFTILAFGVVLTLTQTTDLTYRYGYPLLLVMLLTLLSGLSLLPHGQSRQRILGGLSLLFFLLYGSSLMINYGPLAKDGDWQRVAAYITSLEQPNQPILGFSAEAMMPLTYYYHGRNQILPLPHPVSQNVYRPEEFVLQQESEISTALAQVPGDHAEIWLVTGPRYILGNPDKEPCQLFGTHLNCQILEQFVQKNYTVEQSQAFYGSRVRFLRQKLPSPS